MGRGRQTKRALWMALFRSPDGIPKHTITNAAGIKLSRPNREKHIRELITLGLIEKTPEHILQIPGKAKNDISYWEDVIKTLEFFKDENIHLLKELILYVTIRFGRKGEQEIKEFTRSQYQNYNHKKVMKESRNSDIKKIESHLEYVITNALDLNSKLAAAAESVKTMHVMELMGVNKDDIKHLHKQRMDEVLKLNSKLGECLKEINNYICDRSVMVVGQKHKLTNKQVYLLKHVFESNYTILNHTKEETEFFYKSNFPTQFIDQGYPLFPYLNNQK
jgi:hypothetical protein